MQVAVARGSRIAVVADVVAELPRAGLTVVDLRSRARGAHVTSITGAVGVLVVLIRVVALRAEIGTIRNPVVIEVVRVDRWPIGYRVRGTCGETKAQRMR